MLWLLASSLAYLNAARSSRVNRSVSVSLRPKRYRSICLSLRDIDLTANGDEGYGEYGQGDVGGEAYGDY